MFKYLIILIYITNLDILTNFSNYFILEIFPMNNLQYFFNAKVTFYKVIMIHLHQLIS